MNLQWTENAEAFAEAAAQHVLAAVQRKPGSVIALPTGGTPKGLYRYLVGQKEARARLQQAFYFNLDEYVGVAAADPQSFAAFVNLHFLAPLAVPPGQNRLLRGDAADPAAEAASYDAEIALRGGLDLAILGLGGNGHIAFNEPDAAWDAGTTIVALTPETRAANMAYVPAGMPVPEYGITMGIGTLRAARQVLLLVSGEAKRVALHQLLAGQPDQNWPVTSLCDHPNLNIVADIRLKP